ncbi:MAG: DNA mismatch repair protein MutS [Bacilli bacterium]|nr:DNA mismatch repair protein MutS [Bacilli bacterium]
MEKKYSPMIEQYLSVKNNYKDTLLFYRVGDFYELFFDDAKIASRELELVLTGKDAGVEERVAMCGVPHHAVKGYLEKLVEKGYKVAIVEQVEDPATAKGIVKRDVVQVVTPGTLVDLGLKDTNNNFLCYLESYANEIVISYVDISIGELYALNIKKDFMTLKNELDSLEVKEIVINSKFDYDLLLSIKENCRVVISYQETMNEDSKYDALFNKVKDNKQIKAVRYLIAYLLETQKRSLDYLKEVKVVVRDDYLQMDNYSRVNLELVRTIKNENRYGSLLWVLDKCKTALGSRLLKNWLVSPLSNVNKIEERLRIVDGFTSAFIARQEVINLLKEVYDLERLIARICYGSANGRDLLQLKRSLTILPSLKEALKNSGEMDLFVLSQSLKDFTDLVELIESSISEDAPITVKEGGVIKDGYHKELDEYRYISKNGKKYISEIENIERERTGIKGLKIGYNKVFGYYLEVTNSYLNLVKDEFGWIRKQTLTGAERFITPELKEKEDMIYKAENEIVKLEYNLFVEIKEKVKERTSDIQELAETIAYIDVLSNFALVASENNYCRPIFNEDGVVNLTELRHPVIEKLIGKENFVKNNYYIDNDNFLQIITGPNMGGKSTILRQIAIVAIMGQIGCYVPCESANLTVFDKIFTRIGASDDLVSGKSTFMVEMNEANNALRNATDKSLILFDELGRGTSTYDGMALAQAIIEYIALNIKAKTLFSTHYHELTLLEGKIEGIVNKNVSVYEENDKVTFLYKLIDGKANKSYGINVARLASLPDMLLDRAKDILNHLETVNNIDSENTQIIIKEVTPEYVKEIKNIDPYNMTPIEALQYLIELKDKVK